MATILNAFKKNENDRIVTRIALNFFPQESNWQQVSIGSGNGSATKRRQANADLVHWRIYAALGEMDFNKYDDSHYKDTSVCLTTTLLYVGNRYTWNEDLHVDTKHSCRRYKDNTWHWWQGYDTNFKRTSSRITCLFNLKHLSDTKGALKRPISR